LFSARRFFSRGVNYFVSISYISLYYAAMASKSAVLRLTPLVRPGLSRTNARRLDQLLKVLNDDGKAVLAVVLEALYPQQERDAALTAFRQFRREMALAAGEVGIRLTLKTDGRTRSTPSDRMVWFEAEDRVVEEIKRLVEAEIGDVDRLPQDVKEDRPLRFFVSYAHTDGDLKTILLGKLQTLLRTHPLARFELWTDGEILPGKEWLAEIRDAMEACDFGLLLVSPSFLASKFITKEELPKLLQNKPVIPVALKPILLDGSMDLKGLEKRQIFYDERRREFSERITDRTRDAFAKELFQKICARLAERSAPAPVKPKYELHMRSAICDFDEERFVHTEGVMTTLSKGLEPAPEIDPSRRKDAIEFLTEWIEDEKSPPYCALLGEYGMGKTTTCKKLARDLLDRRDRGEVVPLPIYLDLRHVGESARRELVLQEILELILKRSWKGGPEEASLSAQELIKLVENEGALVIWDGLDEVLVHLDANPGQMFTRQLFRILPPARKGEPRRGRMLISCRTHYFRTLRDQQNHFRAEDRDNVREQDYRAPFVLLPFTPVQIRQYLEHTLPHEDPGRVMAVLKTVHNLEEMAERPYTLSLIANEFAQIEQWKAEGRRVTGLMLYRHMVMSWLERDEGKHQLTRDHKQALMEHVAAELWRAGSRFWSVGELEQWLIDFLEARPDLAAHYKIKDRELLKEDLRTATFLVREGEDKFRFAHTSLQEYFLAGYLRRALVEGRPEAWDLPRVSRETMDFLGQWIEGENNRDAVLSTLGRLRETYHARASELAFEYFLLAARKGYPAPSPVGFQLPGADLSGWEISGSAAAPLVLAGLNLGGARLWNSHWRYCNLETAVFDGADGMRTEWLDCHLAGSSWRGAALEATVFRDCEMGATNFEAALCQRTQWLRCGLVDARNLPAGRPEALYALCRDVPAQEWNEPTPQARVATATGHQNRVMGCAWSPDGPRIVSASYDKTLHIWDAKSGSCLATLAGHQNLVMGCAWSPDGLRIVSASSDQTLRIWDAKSGFCLATLSGHESEVTGCAWSPDGLRIVSASYDKTLRIWDAKSSSCLATLAGHQDWVLGCAWSADGLRILSASSDRALRMWDAKSGSCLATLAGHHQRVTGCGWSPDGLRIVSASYDETLRIWDAKYGSCLATLSGHESEVTGCAWSPDGLRIVSASSDRTLRIWDAKSGSCLATLIGHHERVTGCGWSPDGLRTVSGSDDKTLRIWDAKSGFCLATLAEHETEVMGCGWSPDGLRIVSASDDKMLRIWDAKCGSCIAAVPGHKHTVRGCAFSPDGLRIVSGSDDKTLRIQDAKSGSCLATLIGHHNGVTGCAWFKDGLRIVSASHDKTLRIWNAKSGSRLATLTGHHAGVRCCGWSPDGLRIVSGSDDKTLRIWDAKSGSCLATLIGHREGVMGCAWSPDGLRIVSASYDKTLRIWDAKSGSCLTTLAGHQHFGRGCAWAPDGLRIVSASDDNTLRIWDAKSGSCLATLPGHQKSVIACSWSPDGLRIVSASSDGTLRTWDATTYVGIAPQIYQFSTPAGESTWCSVDHPGNRILACGAEAWRSLGWVVPDPVTGLPEMLPAETFGPLPIV
jgi:WD40 repeat protein